MFYRTLSVMDTDTRLVMWVQRPRLIRKKKQWSESSILGMIFCRYVGSGRAALRPLGLDASLEFDFVPLRYFS